jgi:membrane protein YdbS with pleckstrin-like domain
MAGPLPDKPALTDGSSFSAPNRSEAVYQKDGQGRPQRASELEETDVWWGSYAGRAMLPGFLLCLLLTIILLVLDWHFGNRHSRSDLISSGILGLIGAVWLFQGTRWFYCLIAVNYRLTNRRLFYSRGFKLPDTWAIDLTHITKVAVERGPAERLLGLGRIRIHVQDRDSQRYVLDGVTAPEHVARTIRRRVRQALALRASRGE